MGRKEKEMDRGSRAHEREKTRENVKGTKREDKGWVNR